MRQGNLVAGQGSNSVLVGDFNERVVLTELRRRGPSSKADLARLVGLTRNAAGEIVRKLERSGLVRATGKRISGRGQPATILELNPKGAYAIGVRIDRDLIECLLVDLGGGILDRMVAEELPNPSQAVTAVAATIDRFQRSLPLADRSRLIGIGVAMPDHLGSWLPELGLPPERFRIWDQFDFGPALSREVDLPVVVENDGNAAAVGELNHGHGRALNDFLYVFLGPATGGGVVLEGDYLRGHTGRAGDLGLMPVTPSKLSSAPVSGRAFDPLLSRASLKTLMRHVAAAGLPAGTLSEVGQSISKNPELFNEWQADAVDALVGPLLASVRLLDIKTIVLDGDLTSVKLDSLLGHLAGALTDATAESRDPPRILRGALGRDAAAMGAAVLPLHLNFSPRREVLTRRTNPEAHP